MSKKVLMKGNDAVAEAAIQAGCKAYFAYPITPQNEVGEYFAWRMPEVGGVFIQAESEIAAANMVYGAASTGVRSMTSSSSPGIALKQECISYLSGAEIPAVILNMMRGGPGLGNISGSQADYNMCVKGGGNGDYHCIVLAPSNVQELAELTFDAFDLSDKYRIVTILLGDGYLANMSEPLIMPEREVKQIDKPWALTGAKGRKPQKLCSLRLADGQLPIHVEALSKKWNVIENNEVRYDEYLTEDADYILVAYGTASRVCRAAIKALRAEGIKVGLFRPITLWPFPTQKLNELSTNKKKVLVVEMSLGQMVADVKLAVNGKTDVDLLAKTGGDIQSPKDIIERIKSYGN